MISIASLVWFANDLETSAAFYRALGVPLVDEAHGDGPHHVAVEIGDVHIAIYQAEADGPARAPSWRTAASVFQGWYVESLDLTRDAVLGLGAELLADHQRRPWGCRFVVQDPDGHAVEVNQRDHCG